MNKVEERIKTHNEKIMESLKQKKEEREKRRRSFHEVIFSKFDKKNIFIFLIIISKHYIIFL